MTQIVFTDFPAKQDSQNISESFAIEEAPLMFKYGSFWPITHITDSVDSVNDFIQSTSMNQRGLTGVIRETDELIFVAPFQAIEPF